jgi:putative acetyltransferase
MLVVYRDILPEDNSFLAEIIRSSLMEYRDNLEGTVFEDPTTDTLYEVFNSKAKSHYHVLEDNDGTILGGGGIYPSPGLDSDTVELVKMYLLPRARGKGYGLALLKKSINKAKELGYKKVYIETLPELKEARKLYELFGFEYINKPKGQTGHVGCDVWMILNI